VAQDDADAVADGVVDDGAGRRCGHRAAPLATASWTCAGFGYGMGLPFRSVRRKSSHSNPDGGACLEVSDDFDAVVPVAGSRCRYGIASADAEYCGGSTASVVAASA
jgi:hypothetical protein